MWLFMLQTDQGDEPFLLDEREAPKVGSWEWRRVAQVDSRDEVYALLASAPGRAHRRRTGTASDADTEARGETM